MSIVYCEYCRENIDTDYNAEHFVYGTEHCLMKAEEAVPELLEALKYLVHLHHCEMEGVGVGMPAAEEWKNAVRDAEQAIKKATE